MKKILTTIILGLAITLGCQAQESVPAKAMTQDELQKALAPLVAQLQAIPDNDQANDAAKAAAVTFIKDNQNDAGVYVVCAFLPQVMEDSELADFVSANDFLKGNEKVANLMKAIESKKASSEGHMFIDFEAVYDGKTTKLSDYVGKGKYVLVDFWASWCGPCKAEIPNLIKVYEKYKGEKFDVLGVATWDKPEATLKAIDQLKITYPQMLNAQQAGSSAYGIQGIPEIILFGPDGTILKRGLRGEAIEQTVSEYLK